MNYFFPCLFFPQILCVINRGKGRIYEVTRSPTEINLCNCTMETDSFCMHASVAYFAKSDHRYQYMSICKSTLISSKFLIFFHKLNTCGKSIQSVKYKDISKLATIWEAEFSHSTFLLMFAFVALFAMHFSAIVFCGLLINWVCDFRLDYEVLSFYIL